MKRLKTSNTIRTAWCIYRDRFQEYYRLAFTNSFWLFVPVYGWAKYAAMMGLLVRLAYGDVSENPETIIEARRDIKSRIWLFFGAGLMGGFVFYSRLLLFLFLLFLIIPAIGFLLLSAIVAVSGYNQYSSESFYLSAFLTFTSFALYCYYYFRLIARLFLYKLPLTINTDTKVSRSRDISWHLATDSIFQIQKIIFFFVLLYLFSYSILHIVINFIFVRENLKLIANLPDFYYLDLFLFLATIALLPQTILLGGVWLIPIFFSGIDVFPSTTHFYEPYINIFLNLAFGALFVPLWQSLKAVTYYKLNLDSENADLGID